jgi:hypothetical protein
MFGFRYIKVPPTSYLMQFVGGKVVREGLGRSFIYFAPYSTLVAVPVGSTDAPFIVSETTADFQAVSVQGHLTYRIADAKKLAALLDYSVNPNGSYATDDPTKLVERITQAAQTAMRPEIQSRTLRQALLEAEPMARHAMQTLREAPVLNALGIEVLEFAVLAVRPTPETAKALEAQAREQLLREADDAIYARRNNAVEQERVIRENELNTDLAVEAKQRQLEEEKLAGEITLEQRRTDLVELEAANTKTRAEAQAFAIEAQLKPLTALDPKALNILAARSIDPRQMVAMAFQDIAANAEKVGNLNISPDLLETLLKDRGRGR